VALKIQQSTTSRTDINSAVHYR